MVPNGLQQIRAQFLQPSNKSSVNFHCVIYIQYFQFYIIIIIIINIMISIISTNISAYGHRIAVLANLVSILWLNSQCGLQKSLFGHCLLMILFFIR